MGGAARHHRLTHRPPAGRRTTSISGISGIIPEFVGEAGGTVNGPPCQLPGRFWGRHTFATRLAEDGASATEIQALLGHESLNTSQGYIDATANATRQAARANRTYRALRDLVPSQPDVVVIAQHELG